MFENKENYFHSFFSSFFTTEMTFPIPFSGRKKRKVRNNFNPSSQPKVLFKNPLWD